MTEITLNRYSSTFEQAWLAMRSWTRHPALEHHSLPELVHTSAITPGASTALTLTSNQSSRLFEH